MKRIKFACSYWYTDRICSPPDTVYSFVFVRTHKKSTFPTFITCKKSIKMHNIEVKIHRANKHVYSISTTNREDFKKMYRFIFGDDIKI